MQQVAVAAHGSPVLLLSRRPTTGLDPRSKLEVQEFVIREGRSAHDLTILLCTHDLAEEALVILLFLFFFFFVFFFFFFFFVSVVFSFFFFFCSMADERVR